MEISRYLHFADNDHLLPQSDPNFDKLGKIRPIVDFFKSKFQRLYKPTRHNAVDEAMIHFKGRSSLKQYMPKKPIKRGIKVWVRADSANGYFCDFDVYTGASASPEKGLGATVLKRLTASLESKHYHVFCDNYFTGIDFISDLLEDGIYACGTLRSNHVHFPQELKPLTKKGLKRRGDSAVCQAGNLVLSIWQDNKPVTVLSTNAQPIGNVSVQRRQKDGTRVDVPCPESVALYNQYMGGVDKGDQLCQYYSVRTKSRKMYKYIFWFLFDATIANAFILYNHTPHMGKSLPLKEFRAQLARELIGDYNSRKHAGRPRQFPTPRTSGRVQALMHFPRKVQKGRCRQCQSGSTTWYCSECGLGLCHSGTDTDCFMQYHIEKELYNYLNCNPFAFWYIENY